MTSTKLLIGKIVGFRGLRGEAKVRCESEDPSWLSVLKHVSLVLPDKSLEVRITSGQGRDGRMVMLKFEGFPDRTSLEPWLNAELYAQASDLPAPDEGEYLIDDLLGLSVVDHATGKVWGKVKDLLSSTGQDFLELSLEGKTETVVIPFIDPFFPVVALEKGIIHVDKLSDFLAEAGEA